MPLDSSSTVMLFPVWWSNIMHRSLFTLPIRWLVLLWLLHFIATLAGAVEGGMTNGRAMMKFNRGFMRFSEGLPIVPVALRASLPWNISTHTLTSSFLSNMFWYVSRRTTSHPSLSDHWSTHRLYSSTRKASMLVAASVQSTEQWYKTRWKLASSPDNSRSIIWGTTLCKQNVGWAIQQIVNVKLVVWHDW